MWRRVCASLAVVCLAGVVPVGAVGASEHLGAVEVVRLGGADRYGTSLLVAEGVAADAGGSLEWVVVVSGESWPDAVVASSAAGELGAAVVLTPSGGVRADALGFLARTGVSRALVVSTGDAVSSVVDEQLGAVGVSVERVGGADRYETSVAVARRLGAPGVLGTWGRTVLVASGEVFADALVAGPLSAHGGHPVLLTPQDALHPSVASYLGGSGAVHAVVLGGTAALSAQVSDAVAALGIGVERVAGATRVGTATRTAALTAAQMVSGCPRRAQLGVARADVPFDAFAAGPLLAGRCAALVLSGTGEVPNLTASYINRVRSKNLDGVTLHVFGGNAAIAQTAIDDYLKTTEQAGGGGGGGGGGGSGGGGGGGNSGSGGGGAGNTNTSVVVTPPRFDPPRFDPPLTNRTVEENNSLNYQVRAVDDDSQDRIESYTLQDHASHFSINSNGLLTSNDPLNYEEQSTWTLTIKATSGIGNRADSVTGTVTITVDNVRGEIPEAPPPPEASSSTAESLTMVWVAPVNEGPAIVKYNVGYRSAGTNDDWVDTLHSSDARTVTVDGLAPFTAYEFRVNAHNDDGSSGWSGLGTAKTLAASEPDNNGPEFTSLNEVGVEENTPLSYQVTATDPDDLDRSTAIEYYEVGGDDRTWFKISREGMLTLETGLDLNFEVLQKSYEILVSATSGSTEERKLTSFQTITVTVTDALEPPERPSAPRWTDPGRTDTSTVIIYWAAPTNSGRPAIDGYDVQYKKPAENENLWKPWSHVGTDLTATVIDLEENTAYEFRVRANNNEGKGVWSESTVVTSSTINRFPVITTTVVYLDEHGLSQVTWDLEASDADGDSITKWEAVGGNSDGHWDDIYDDGFSITESGKLISDGRWDYEEWYPWIPFQLPVRVFSGVSGRELSTVQTISVYVNDVLEPGGMTSLETTDQTDTTITVKWSSDLSVDFGGTYLVFIVKHGTDIVGPDDESVIEIPVFSDQTTRTATINYLHPDTAYDIYVTPRHNDGYNLDGMLLMNISTLP